MNIIFFFSASSANTAIKALSQVNQVFVKKPAKINEQSD